MTVKSKLDNGTLEISINGRLDTNTTPEFQNELNSLTGGSLKNIHLLIMDLTNLGYISSAGLRAILMIQKEMTSNEGKFIIKNVQPDVNEVFEVTGFLEILTIE